MRQEITALRTKQQSGFTLVYWSLAFAILAATVAAASYVAYRAKLAEVAKSIAANQQQYEEAVSKIKAGSLDNGSVGLDKLDGSIAVRVELPDGSVVKGTLIEGVVVDEHVVAGSTIETPGSTTVINGGDAITTLTLEDGSVTSAKIADGAVGTAKLADGSVTEAKIKNGVITGGKIAPNTITGGLIANDGSVVKSIVGNSVLAATNNNDGSVSLSLTTSCANGQVLKWDGSSWACANDGGGTSYTAGSGLSLSGSEFTLDATSSAFLSGARGAVSSTATGLTYSSASGVFSLTSGYSIPTDVLIAGWNNKLGTLNGLAGDTQTFATGTSGTDFGISSSGTTHTFNIPDASATARGLVTTGAQTFSGNKTLSNDLSVNGNLRLTGGLYDSTSSQGSNGMVLTSTGSATQWAAVSDLGLTLSDISQANLIGSPTSLDNLEEIVDTAHSAGVVQGAAITDNGDGTVSIGAGQALLRSSASSTATIYSVAFNAQSNIALTDNATNYIYLDYNSGSPQFNVGTSIGSFNCLDKCLAYVVTREGTSLNIVNASQQNVDGNRKERRRLLETQGFQHATGGSTLGASGTRNISVTSGAFYYGLDRLDHGAFDTSGASAFVYYYRNGGGGWTKTTGNTQINNTQYDDGDGTLGTLSNNRYGVFWVYLVNGTTASLAVQYGQGDYNTLAAARASTVPTAPPALQGVGALLGRIIIQKNATTFAATESAFTASFIASTATIHNGLAGLQGGTTDEYYHLTSSEYTGTGTGVFVRADSPKLSGNVGIGQASPGVKLHIGDSSVADGTSLLRLEDTNSTCNFTADTGSPLCGSDQTLKKDISSLNTGNLLDKIANLRPVSYRWNTDDVAAPLKFGFVAQEVEAQFPELVREGTWVDDSTRKFLNMGGLMPYVAGAVKELDSKVADLEAFVYFAKTGALTLNGDLTVNGRAVFKAPIYVGSDTAGEATLLPGKTSVEVVFSKPYEGVPVVTATPLNAVGAYHISNASSHGFTITVSQSRPEDVRFNWIAIGRD